MTRWVQLLLTMTCAVTLAACAGTAGIREQFDKSVKNYNKMLRWQEATSAGITYMVPDRREEFIRSADLFKKRGVSITDYRILTTECIPDKGTGEAVTEFDYYILPSNRIKTLTYRQEWVYQETDGSKNWRLKTPLPPFE